MEANIALKNGLSLPIMSEYFYRENNQLTQSEGKQDCETTAFGWLVKRLKAAFLQIKMFFFMGGMFATQQIVGILSANHWEYAIRLPRRKLTDLSKSLNKNKSLKIELPQQLYYRKRKQSFYWENNITYGYDWQLTIHLMPCFEGYEIVNPKSGEIENRYSEHALISSIPIRVANLHELLNLGVRKMGLIETVSIQKEIKGIAINTPSRLTGILRRNFMI